MPWAFSSSTMRCMMGRLATGTMGLGIEKVRGRRRVPKPPAMLTPFIFLVLVFGSAGSFLPGDKEQAERVESPVGVEPEQGPGLLERGLVLVQGQEERGHQ